MARTKGSKNWPALLSNRIRLISLSWGVQSWTMAAMLAMGELPTGGKKIDGAIWADTGHEREATYAFAARWQPWLEERGVKVITVKADNTEVVSRNNRTPIPLFILNEEGRPAMIQRRCTYAWKIQPIHAKASEMLRARGFPKREHAVTLLIGITIDEFTRARTSEVLWVDNHYPFLYDIKMSRDDCVRWLEARGLELPPKSSCVFCPLQDRRSRLSLSANDIARVREVEQRIQKIPQWKGNAWLSSALKPIGSEDADDIDRPCDGGFCFV